MQGLAHKHQQLYSCSCNVTHNAAADTMPCSLTVNKAQPLLMSTHGYVVVARCCTPTLLLQTMYGGLLASTRPTAGDTTPIPMPPDASPATMMTQLTSPTQMQQSPHTPQSRAVPAHLRYCVPTTTIQTTCLRTGITSTATCRGCPTTCTACMVGQGH